MRQEEGAVESGSALNIAGGRQNPWHIHRLTISEESRLVRAMNKESKFGSWIEINRCGCTRLVILLWRWAIKFPNPRYEWRHFLQGLLANMQEVTFSKTKWVKLCPVLWSLPGGWILVMRRAQILTDEEFLSMPEDWRDEPEYSIPAEMKSDSFGWLNGRIVAVDYGS